MINRVYITILMLLIATTAYAKDLGIVGAVYQIRESDLLESIESKLKANEASGKLAALHAKYSNEVRAQVTKPRRIAGISNATTDTIRFYDPTHELDEEIRIPGKDGAGDVVYPVGTKVNPLDYQDFDVVMLFIDGEEEAQRDFAHDQVDKNPKTTIILINGEPGQKHVSRVSKSKKIQPEERGINKKNNVEEKSYYYYYDQWGMLSKKFGITRVPSLIYQNKGEKQLTIKEVYCGQKNN